MIPDVMNAYANHAAEMNAVSFIPFIGGYVGWIYYILLPIREGKLPIPFWLITFWFAHDSTAAVIFAQLAATHGGFWFFKETSIALVIWVIIEITGMAVALKYARQDIWGRYYALPVTPVQAMYHIIPEIILMYVVVNLLRVYMADDVMLKWFTLTNAVLAIGPWYLLKERKTRQGGSAALLIVLAVVVGQTFLPPGFGMFTTASAAFNTPWFYMAGLVFFGLAIWNVITFLKLPAKPVVHGKMQIW